MSKYSKSTIIKCHIVQAICGLIFLAIVALLAIACDTFTPCADPRDNTMLAVVVGAIMGLWLIFTKKLWIVDVINFFEK